MAQQAAAITQSAVAAQPVRHSEWSAIATRCGCERKRTHPGAECPTPLVVHLSAAGMARTDRNPLKRLWYRLVVRVARERDLRAALRQDPSPEMRAFVEFIRTGSE
jgi:hypothetical protein